MKHAILIFIATSIAFSKGEDAVKANKNDVAKFQGTWQLISAEKEGKQTPADVVAKIKVVIKGIRHTVYFGDKAVAMDIPFTLDATKNPKTTDDHLPDGKLIRGIYELKGDTLKSCVAAADKERPTEFAAKVGTGQTLRFFKRVKP